MNGDKILKRKQMRMPNYDYARNGAYFVTICTLERMPILSLIMRYAEQAPKTIHTRIGDEVEKTIKYINENYRTVNIEKYVIMPNHVHIIVSMQSTNVSEEYANISLQTVIGNLKSYTTKRYNDIQGTKNKILWQRSFYDRVIRDEQEYLDVWRYIDENPIQWDSDEYHPSCM